MTRVRAPELRGRGWLNTDGRAVTLADLRGKIVLLDFWTFCCVNCLHVLDELRPLEEKYADVLVTIGVHSPKFEHERDPVALAAAVERYGVAHPVLDDPDLEMWRQYTARAWPTLCVLDPEGYVVATMAGEGHADGLARLIDELVVTHTAKGTLRRSGAGPYVPPTGVDTTLRFPGKAVAAPGGGLLVADSAHHSIVELAADGETVLRRIGSGQRGRTDGAADAAQFSEPGGMCLLPDGHHLIVADTVNHLLRSVDLATGEVSTVAGTGRQWRSTVDFNPHDALAVDLSSPWDLAWYDDKVIIAMAGIHQLWWYDPVKRTAGGYAGTTVEALRDGALDQAWFAQPSGLAVSADGGTLWIADSESSALRFIRDGELHTAIGQGLFDFGHVDGPADQAMLQHPLGVAALPDGSVLIADTYNGAIRRFDPATNIVTTVATDLAEPSDIVLLPPATAAGPAAPPLSADLADPAAPAEPTAVAEPPVVIVVESAAHRLTRLAPGTLAAAGASTVAGVRQRTERPPTMLAPGEVTLEVIFTPALGQKLDDSFGPSTRLQVTASPPELLIDGSGSSSDLHRRLVLSSTIDSGTLQVVAQAATCDADQEHAACHLTRQDWGVPIVITPAGAARLPLLLRGLDPG